MGSFSQQFQFGTKATTLERLKPLVKKSQICELFYFTAERWNKEKKKILKEIQKEFPKKFLAIRSSALIEDQEGQSMAGAFQSVLDVNTTNSQDISSAIEKVLQSYSKTDPKNQVLIQEMIRHIAVSGVITTYCLEDGAPYYVINYDDESGKTDTITGGTGVNKTVLIHRDTEKKLIESPRVKLWFDMIKELESVIGPTPLDIEFAQNTRGQLYVLQVRKIATAKNWNQSIVQQTRESQRYIEEFIADRSHARPGIVGDRTIFGEMPDWNPAEIIGTTPRPLAASLYQELVTDEIWRQARAKMGYRNPEFEKLMTVIGGRPFIDVRNSFNSFLPERLSDDIGDRLVSAWLKRLDQNPQFHDKVEFEVAQTILHFDFENEFKSRYPNALTNEDFKTFKESLLQLTQIALNIEQDGSLNSAIYSIHKLEELQKSYLSPNKVKKIDRIDCLSHIAALLQQCKNLGTLPFSVIARHGFIAETFLRSAVTRGALSAERLTEFKSSIETIATTLSRDFQKAQTGNLYHDKFLERYGHLRPGTYDVLSLRYDQRPELFSNASPSSPALKKVFKTNSQEDHDINRLFKEIGVTHFNSQKLFKYAEIAIAGREYAKFIFTRNISDALEFIVLWGKHLSLTRDEISYLSLNDIMSTLDNPVLHDNAKHFSHLSQTNRHNMAVTQNLKMSYIIRDTRDVFVIPLHRGAPNFVTQERIEGDPVFLDSRSSAKIDLKNRIVCIENADPGFDWIFTRNIKALVTKFGGANSHMAIRCAEFKLPAAIGCGEQTFDRLVKAKKIELNCADKIVRPLYE